MPLMVRVIALVMSNFELNFFLSGLSQRVASLAGLTYDVADMVHRSGIASACQRRARSIEIVLQIFGAPGFYGLIGWLHAKQCRSCF
jgi:hypothetical protein